MGTLLGVTSLSKYTTELRYICETLAGKTESEGYDSIDTVINTALPLLFNFDFPIFDEEYRATLEKKIVMHYYRREICAETVGLWKLYLNTKLNEIMPYYNQLYRTTVIEFNPLYDIDLHRSHSKTGSEAGSGTNSGTSQSINAQTGTTNKAGTNSSTDDVTSTNSSSGTSLDAYSDTPNNKLSNVTELDYLTNLRKVTDTGSNTGHDVANRIGNSSVTDTINLRDQIDSGSNSQYSNSVNTTENYIETITGSTGGASYSKRIAEFRKNILNIDMQIINELESLFFGLW